MGIAWRDYDLVRRQLAEVRNTIKDMVTAPSWCPFENTLNSDPTARARSSWSFCCGSSGCVCSAVGHVTAHLWLALSKHWNLRESVFDRISSSCLLIRCLAALGEAVGAEMKIAVELDGHDFHERTKEQVKLRDRRDRVLQRHGWIVLHISGSELVREPQVEALKEVWLCSEDQMGRLREAVAKEWGAPLRYSAPATVGATTE
jgi:hypothetical protein